MIKSMSEILEIVDKASTIADKVRILQENRSQALVDLLMGAFDARIKWLLPEGPVPYKPTKVSGLEDRLYQEVRRFYIFVENGGTNISQTKRESLFIEMLENMNPRDAKLLEAVKDKKLPFPSISVSIFAQAFPDISIQPVTPTAAPPTKAESAISEVAKPKRKPATKSRSKKRKAAKGTTK